jgi:hypothetical protein
MSWSNGLVARLVLWGLLAIAALGLVCAKTLNWADISNTEYNATYCNYT